MELRLPYMLNLLRENCAQVLEEELHRMLGIKYVNDEHDCNVVSMNSLNIQMLLIYKATSLKMLYLTNMIFLFPQVLMRKFIMMIECLLFMMIILMKVDLERL